MIGLAGGYPVSIKASGKTPTECNNSGLHFHVQLPVFSGKVPCTSNTCITDQKKKKSSIFYHCISVLGECLLLFQYGLKEIQQSQSVALSEFGVGLLKQMNSNVDLHSEHYQTLTVTSTQCEQIYRAGCGTNRHLQCSIFQLFKQAYIFPLPTNPSRRKIKRAQTKFELGLICHFRISLKSH